VLKGQSLVGSFESGVCSLAVERLAGDMAFLLVLGEGFVSELDSPSLPEPVLFGR